VFEGIRYAAPPVGSLRWAPPTAATAPSGTVVASSFGNQCPQSGGASEDCLFLNVWSPANVTPSSQVPVFFWIHGGGFVNGDSSTFDPSTLVQSNNIIVVTVNYRLGAFGWLVEPGLAASTANTYQSVGDAGDYGLMDQQFAMQWVQSNIAAFGGDPAKVTIGGESAGGVSVMAHLTSTATAASLFRGAIIESGSYAFHAPTPSQSANTFNAVPTQSAYQTSYAQSFASYVGCATSDATCLRNVSTDNVFFAQTAVFASYGISPVSGTKVLPMSLPSALSAGSFIRVPVLQGTNANEGTFFEPGLLSDLLSPPTTTTNAAGGPANYDLTNSNSTCANPHCTYTQEVNALLGSVGVNLGNSFNTTVAGEYPVASYPDPYLSGSAPTADEALSQVYTDLVFACNAYEASASLAAHVSVYAYEFNDPNAPPYTGFTPLVAPNDVDGFSTGSQHTAELPFLFDDFVSLSTSEQQLATELKAYWGNFIVTGSPNGTGLSSWTAFGSGNVQNLVPGTTSTSTAAFSANHFCGSSWNSVLASE
jgi:para-nitrobenzyl esterase